MGKASAPPPPDYIGLANQQHGLDLETAKFNLDNNRVNQYTPFGNLTWSKGPQFDDKAYNTAMLDWQKANATGTPLANAKWVPGTAGTTTKSGGAEGGEDVFTPGTEGYWADATGAKILAPDGLLASAPKMSDFTKDVWSQTTKLAPAQQALLDALTKSQLDQSKLLDGATAKVGDVMSKDFDWSKFGTASELKFDPSGLKQTPYDTKYGVLAGLKNNVDAGPLKYDYATGPDFQSTLSNVDPLRKTIGTAPTLQTSFGDAGGLQTSIDASGGPAVKSLNTGVGGLGSISLPELQKVAQLGAGPQFQRSIAGAGGLGAINDASRKRVEDALFSRLNPQLERDEYALRQRLLNSGIEVGSDAYNKEMTNFGQRVNDARMQAVLQGGNEETRQGQLAALFQGQNFNQKLQEGQFSNNAASAMSDSEIKRYEANLKGADSGFNQGLQRAGLQQKIADSMWERELQGGKFSNDAAQMEFDNALKKGTFANSAQAQLFSQLLARAGFSNTAMQNQFGMEAENAKFENAAQKQGFDQELSKAGLFNAAATAADKRGVDAADFWNKAQGTAYSQGLSNANLFNSAAEKELASKNSATEAANSWTQKSNADNLAVQGFLANMQARDTGFNNTLRQNNITEALMQRNQPLSELSALKTGAMPTQPQFQPYYTSGMANTADLLGAGKAQGQYDAANAANEQSGMNALLAALSSLGVKFLSDRRLKRNIRRIGTHPSGVARVSWDWIDGSGSDVGVIAQELAEVRPDAVVRGADGYLRVDYSMIGGR